MKPKYIQRFAQSGNDGSALTPHPEGAYCLFSDYLEMRRETTCSMCKYRHCYESFHVRAGPGGYRGYSCQHPDAWDSIPADTPEQAEVRGMLRESERSMCGGRMIGRTERTPDWCPYLREENNQAQQRRATGPQT